MKVIIVDDEPKAIALLSSYLSHFSDFELIATFRNGLKALNFLNNHTVDLVLLDINMPHLSGISLSKMIAPSTKIIFTTAYSEYAVESYEVTAVDYLLKPINLERFTKAISKMIGTSSPAAAPASSVIMVKSGAKIFRVDAADILFLEKDGNYMTYHTKQQKILARESVAAALALLPSHFIQTHKSYIVNIHQMDFIDKNEISIADTAIPIGSSFKEQVLKKISSS